MKKVLVVDDEPALAELIGDFFRQSDFDAKTLTDSLAVMETIKAWKPDLMTLDLEMPGIDGLSLLKTLQSDPLTRNIPVIVISVLAKGAYEEGLLTGAKLVFEKPLKFGKLMRDVDEIFNPSSPVHQKPLFEPYFPRPIG